MRGRVTLDEVAARAGVSRMTVSNTYGHPDRVAEPTRRRVLAAAEELGYGGPSPAARSLRRGSSGVLGVLVGDRLPYLFTDPGAATLMQGLTMEASRADLALQIIHATGPSGPAQVADAVVDSFVAVGLSADDPALRAALGRRVPIVTLQGPPRPGVPGVTIDARAATAEATRHVLDLGHRSVAFVTPPLTGGEIRRGFADLRRQGRATSPLWADRLAGCRAEFERRSLAWADVPVFECAGNSRQEGHDAARRLLTTGGRVRPSAVVAATDVLALGVLDAARRLGVGVPDALTVVGFDDIEDASLSTPALTTVGQDLRAQATEAVAVAIGRLPARPRLRVHPTRLLVRGTSAAPACVPS